MQAIAKAVGLGPFGFETMKILKCPDRDLVGRLWPCQQRAYADEYYLVEFSPQDQFCKIIPLKKE